MVADIPLNEISSAGGLREFLEAYADDHGNRVIPDRATFDVVVSVVGGERMDPVRHVATALRFTWEVP